jgi:hypothetical protein
MPASAMHVHEYISAIPHVKVKKESAKTVDPGLYHLEGNTVLKDIPFISTDNVVLTAKSGLP